MPQHPFTKDQEVYWDLGQIRDGYRSQYGDGPFRVVRISWDTFAGEGQEPMVVVVATIDGSPVTMFAGDPVPARLFRSNNGATPARSDGELQANDPVVWSPYAREHHPEYLELLGDVVMVVTWSDGQSVIVKQRSTDKPLWGRTRVPARLFVRADDDD